MQNWRKLLVAPNITTALGDPVDPNSNQPIGTVAMFGIKV
jgi:hypothetical protein